MFSSRQGFYADSGLGPFTPLTIVANVSRVDDDVAANTFTITFLPPMTSANINWGDGNTQTVTTTGAVTKTYTSGGNKTISVDGIFGAGFGNVLGFYSANKVVDVISWGNSKISNAFNMFRRAQQIETFSAIDSPVFGEGANLTQMLGLIPNFVGDISNWNTSNVTNMTGMFFADTKFNGNIVSWDIGNVTNMTNMFNGATAFNQPIGNWNTSNVTTMAGMFNGATAFNQPIGNWNTSKLSNTVGMFNGATAFNQPIGNWNTSNVTNMNNMFISATSFNKDISSWNTSKTTNMLSMFFRANSFNNGSSAGVRNTGLNRTANGGWQVGNVTNMSNMFANCASANLDVSNWCVTPITTKPAGFDTGAGNIINPTWGTCPIPN